MDMGKPFPPAGKALMIKVMNQLFPAALAAIAVSLPIAATAQPGAAGAITVENAWLRLPAVTGRPAAAYFTLVGGGATARVVKVESGAATRVELHGSRMDGGVMKMFPLAGGVSVPARARIPFRPGGNHAMMFGLKTGLRPTDTVPITFILDGGTKVEAVAQVVGPGEGPGASGHH